VIRTCGLREGTPATFTVFANVIYELLVFLLGPSSFICIQLLTARFPHYRFEREREREREREAKNTMGKWRYI
jgi:hypothetical protein